MAGALYCQTAYYTCMHASIHPHIHRYIDTHTHIYIYIRIMCINIHTYMCNHVNVYSIYNYMSYLCLYIDMYVVYYPFQEETAWSSVPMWDFCQELSHVFTDSPGTSVTSGHDITKPLRSGVATATLLRPAEWCPAGCGCFHPSMNRCPFPFGWEGSSLAIGQGHFFGGPFPMQNRVCTDDYREQR